MDVSPLSRAVRAGDLPIERLAGNPHLSEREKIGELSRQFEGLLLRQILRDIRKPVFKSDLMPESLATDIYQEMVSTQLADTMSKSGSFGLARVLETEMIRRKPETEGSQVPRSREP
jgi:Rod binding domain-containing protein